ncbi:acyltransferase family protein [Aliiglaciecola aliphaticivorans]
MNVAVQSERNINIDLLRAISIFGVVWIHSNTLFIGSSDLTAMISEIFRFSVPVFIIVFSFFLEKAYQRTKTNFGLYVLTKFKHLFVVFVFWSTIYFLIIADFNTLTLKSLITKHWSGYGWSGQYFFIILFQLLFLFCFIRKIVFNKYLLILASIILIGLYIYSSYGLIELSTITQKVSDRPFWFWVPYVLCGIIIAQNNTLNYPIYLIAGVLFIPVEFYFLENSGVSHSPYITLSVMVSSCIFVLPFFSKKIKLSNLIEKIARKLGENTLIIFVANPLVIITLDSIFTFKINNFKVLVSFITCAIVITICLFLDKLIERIPSSKFIK